MKGLLAAALVVATAVSARAADAPAVARALEEAALVEAQLLAEAQANRLTLHEQLAVEAGRLARVTAELAAAIRVLSQAEGEELDRARAAAAATEQEVRVVVGEIERLHRQAAEASSTTETLAARWAALRERARETRSAPEAREPLEGTWDVVVQPAGDRGVFQIRHEGTILSGTYSMVSGRKGSLQGTLVAGRLQLDQVDAQHGRDRSFHGVLSGETLRGTWEQKILGGSAQTMFGNWTARRRVESEAPQGVEP